MNVELNTQPTTNSKHLPGNVTAHIGAEENTEVGDFGGGAESFHWDIV